MDAAAHRFEQHFCVRECRRVLSLLWATGEEKAICVAVSGGADSVALLRVLCGLYPVEKRHCLKDLHFNHHLRGEESDRGEQFVRRICREWGVDCVVGGTDVAASAKGSGLSVEMQARECRYHFFSEQPQRLGASFIFMGHHGGDQLELFFLRLLRGASVEGLRGMRPINEFPFSNQQDIRIVRPFLNCTHQELTDFLRSENLSWVEDSTNSEQDARRNKIRHSLLPLLEEIQPGVSQTLSRTMEILGVESDFLEQSLERQRKICSDFETWHPALQRRAVAKELIRLGFIPTFESVEFLVKNPECAHSCRGINLYRKKNSAVLILPKEIMCWDDDQVTVDLMPNDVREIALSGNVALRCEVLPREKAGEISQKSDNQELFDFSAVGSPIVFRHWRKGDYFQPIGMAHPKKLQDIFVNQKIIHDQRHQLWLAEDQNGDIFWVQNLRIGEKHKLRQDTNWVLRLTFLS